MVRTNKKKSVEVRERERERDPDLSVGVNCFISNICTKTDSVTASMRS